MGDEEEIIIKTVVEGGKSFSKDKGSKFYGFTFWVDSEDAVKECIQTIQDKFPDAKHIAYAFRINADNTQEYTFDAGEPAYTAGTPILNALKRNNLINTCCIVVRYFGGTKLGVRGLIDAYGNSAMAAIKQSQITERPLQVEVLYSFHYKDMAEVMAVIKRLDIQDLKQNFEEEPSLSFKASKVYFYKIAKDNLSPYGELTITNEEF